MTVVLIGIVCVFGLVVGYAMMRLAARIMRGQVPLTDPEPSFLRRIVSTLLIALGAFIVVISAAVVMLSVVLVVGLLL